MFPAAPHSHFHLFCSDCFFFQVESHRFVANILEEEPSDLLAYKLSQKEKKYKDCNVKLIDSKMSLAALLPYGVKREVTYQKFQILNKVQQEPTKEGEEPVKEGAAAGGATPPVVPGSGTGSGNVSPPPQKQGPQEQSVEDLLFGLMKYTLQFSFDALIPADKFPAQGTTNLFSGDLYFSWFLEAYHYYDHLFACFVSFFLVFHGSRSVR